MSDRSFHYLINEDCISCHICVEGCPRRCFTEEDNYTDIHMENCTDCGRCVEFCPMGAIERDEI